jgi:hypothetical protein
VGKFEVNIPARHFISTGRETVMGKLLTVEMLRRKFSDK